MNKFIHTVLVTDDARVNRMIVCKYLEKHGCQVVEAKNGLEALQVLHEQTVSLIFMDIEMPKMDGLTAAKIIRKQNLSKAPIIALTGHNASLDRATLKANGITLLIHKPITAQEIDKIQTRYLDI